MRFDRFDSLEDKKEIGLGAGLAVSAGLGFIGANQANSARKAQFNTNYALQNKLAHSGYQIAMADMKKAGLNPILAGKFGPASASPVAMSNFENEGAAAANSALALTSAKFKDVQTDIADNISYFSDEVKRAYDNSGKNVTDFIANTSWDDLGNMIGTQINKTQEEIVKGLKEMFGSIAEAVKTALGLKEPTTAKGVIPEGGTGTFRVNGNYLD